MIRAELTIRGLVQGVFYRASAQREGVRLELEGLVRNLPTGEVHVVVEGERAAVEAFIAWCRRGPEHARVDEVEIRFADPSGGLKGFLVTR